MTPRQTNSGPNGAGPSLSEGGERGGEGAVLYREAVSKATPFCARHAQKGAALLTAARYRLAPAPLRSPPSEREGPAPLGPLFTGSAGGVMGR